MYVHCAWRKYLALLVVAMTAFAFTLGAAADQYPGEGVTVASGVASWTSALPVSWLFAELMEELGYDMEEPILFPSNPVAYLSIEEGDIDFWPNVWWPLHEPHLSDTFQDRATIFEPHGPGFGAQGYLVDIASIEEYGIRSICDFRRDEVREAFDHTGDGKVDLYGCPPGWGCHEGIEAMLDKFNLHDTFYHHTADYVANFAEALSQIEAGESTLYYTWGPSAWILELVPGEDVMWINAPGIVETEEEIVHGLDEAVTDPIEMGFVAADIAVAANDDFLAANPAAEELFRQVRTDLLWISEVDALIVEEDIGDAEIRELAREWIEDNRELVDEWLEAAREAAAQ